MGFRSKKNRESFIKGKTNKSDLSDSSITILTSGCHFNGQLYCRGSSRIGGRVDGELVSEGLLVIETEAQINAQIRADEAIIQGQIVGKLEATKRVELTATSRVEGEIKAPALVIHEGAVFNGTATMTSGSIAKTEPHKNKTQNYNSTVKNTPPTPEVGIL